MRHPFPVSNRLPTLLLLTVTGLISFAPQLLAQDTDELQIFGSVQTIFFHQESRMEGKYPGFEENVSSTETRNSFALQQLDLFFRKEMGDDFTAFVDLEFQLNYSSEKNWGSLSLQEAWMNYHYSDAFNVKTGLLFPAFNRLNEVKNRLALLPYLFRPLVYERLLSNKFLSEDFVPEHAFIQLHGSIPLGDFFGDYAVYTGNAESSYITKRGPDGSIQSEINPNFEFLSGVDPTDLKLKLFGGRIGLRTRDEQMSCGFSLTHDYNNMRDTTRYPVYVVSSQARALLGDDAPRYRLGADLFLRHGAFTLEGELIKVIYDDALAAKSDLSLEQAFAHGMIGYDILPALTAYVSMQWGDYTFGVDSDYFVYSVGGAYRLNESITAKAQYIIYDESFDDNASSTLAPYEHNIRIKFVFVGFSVLL